MGKNQGLTNKYTITRNDGRPISPEAEFFVLRLDDAQSDKIHRHACLAALDAYRNGVQYHLPELAEDLRERYLGGKAIHMARALDGCMDVLQAEADKARNERDEARAEVERLRGALHSCECFLRGMMFDPSIPRHAITALGTKANKISQAQAEGE